MSDRGRVWANQNRGLADEEAIREGYIRGEGLLGAVLQAALELEDAQGRYTYASVGGPADASVIERLKTARLKLFLALKAVEQAL